MHLSSLNLSDNQKFDLCQAQGLISIQNNRNLKPLLILKTEPSTEFSHSPDSAEAEIFFI